MEQKIKDTRIEKIIIPLNPEDLLFKMDLSEKKEDSENKGSALHAFKIKEIQVAEKLSSLKELGFYPFSPFKGKPVKVEEYNLRGEKVDIKIKTKYGETFFLDLNIDEVDDFIRNFYKETPNVKIINEVEKSIVKDFNGVEIGFTSDYEIFKIYKTFKTPSALNLENLTESFNMFGNIMPIIVCKYYDKLIILEGKTRFDLLKEKQQDIFYIDVTSLIKIPVNESFLTNFIVRSNLNRDNLKLKKVWDNLAKYFNPSYRDLDNFIKENKVCDLINNKFTFILMLENDINKIIKGEANFEKENIENLYFLLRDLYEGKGKKISYQDFIKYKRSI